ncbi:hypothetical protein AM629_07280 [Photorhabdus heterorhabditis]|uniref:WbuO protein n=1 Tax=Photorhabdus heterorhabditis TaxID=880156 RepID=A0ABR5KDK6_9GAMM|nr:hypothetical protein AM629_07280 [Photorhabdus heterorhabditis]
MFLFIPFLYTFKTRLKTNTSRLAWVTTYLIPVFLSYFILFSYDIRSFLGFILGIIIIYSSYEIGYITNDCELTKKEKNPTLRLNGSEFLFYEKNKLAIYSIRYSLLMICLIYIYWCNFPFSLSLILAAAFIQIIYFLYNYIRNRFSIILYSSLVYLRYFGLVFLTISIDYAILLWFIYPLAVTIEFSTKPRFNLFTERFRLNSDMFRVFFYTILILVLFIVITVKKDNSLGFYLVKSLVIYFFIYRLLSYLLISKKYRNAHK